MSEENIKSDVPLSADQIPDDPMTSYLKQLEQRVRALEQLIPGIKAAKPPWRGANILFVEMTKRTGTKYRYTTTLNPILKHPQTGIVFKVDFDKLTVERVVLHESHSKEVEKQ